MQNLNISPKIKNNFDNVCTISNSISYLARIYKIKMTESFPLSWPIGRERTAKYHRKNAPFKTTMGRARDQLLHELKLLGARNIVISSNVATYKRGGQDIMYADQSSAKEDPGVAVYYTWRDDQYCLSCDKWTTVMDNLQALMKTVDAIRGIERWGTGEMMKAAFSGFKALPESSEIKIPMWYEILEVSPNSNAFQIKEAFRKKAMQYHPDRGGNAEMFNRIQNAYQQGLASI